MPPVLFKEQQRRRVMAQKQQPVNTACSGENRVPRTLLEKGVCSMRVLARHPHEDLGWILRFFIARLLRALEKRPSFDMEMTPLPGWRCLSLTHGLWHASSVRTKHATNGHILRKYVEGMLVN